MFLERSIVQKKVLPAGLWIPVVLLALLTFLSRLVLLPDHIESFDAVNYILALSHFDMRIGQPQPPGYILYILAGRGFNLFLHDPHQALLFLSTISSGGAVVAIYLAASEIFEPKTGLIAAGLLGTAPFFWYTGIQAAPYAPDLFIGTLFCWLAFRTMKEKQNSWLPWITAVVCGLAGALRLQTLVFLFPLFLFVLRKRTFWTIFGCTGVALGVFGVFFVPSVVASGGPARFIQSMFGVVPILSSTSAMAQSIDAHRYVVNTVTILVYTFLVIGEQILPFVGIGLFFLSKARKDFRNPRAIFFLVWIIPLWIVFFFIWPGNIATIQVTSSSYFILAAYGLQKLTGHVSSAFRRIAWSTLAVVIILQICIFILLPGRAFGDDYHRFHTWRSLQQITADYQTKIALILPFSSDETVIFATDFRLPQVYLPEYRTYSIPVFSNGDGEYIHTINAIEHGELRHLSDVSLQEILPPGTKQIIFFDPLPPDLNIHNLPLREIRQDHTEISVLELTNSLRINWSSAGLTGY